MADGSRIAALLFIFSLSIFYLSPVDQVSDSRYSILLSESLIRRGTFALDQSFSRPLDSRQHPSLKRNGLPPQLEEHGGNVYYFFPPGSSILSAPLVLVLNCFGLTASNDDGSYDRLGEEKMQRILASFLSAATVVIFYGIARNFLDPSWSILLAFIAGFGSPVWSTLSRAMWSQTWEVLLTAALIAMLVKRRAHDEIRSGVAIGSILSALFWVRPSSIITILLVCLYVCFRCRKMIKPVMMTGLIGLSAFVSLSWMNYSTLLPGYYRYVERVRLESIPEAFMGALLSPSRGFLVYVPWALFVAYMMLRHRCARQYRWLMAISSLGIVGNLVLTATLGHWWGGWSFGPRLMSGSVPWLLLLAAVMLNSILAGSAAQLGRLERLAGAILIGFGLLANGAGALSRSSWEWNATPQSVDADKGRIWDWKRPQFLAGLISWPLPWDFPVLRPATRVPALEATLQNYLWGGWRRNDRRYGWSNGRKASIVFRLEETGVSTFRARLRTFEEFAATGGQKVSFSLNGRELAEVRVLDSAWVDVSVKLPRTATARFNTMDLHFPEARSSSELGIRNDPRVISIAMEWFEIR